MNDINTQKNKVSQKLPSKVNRLRGCWLFGLGGCIGVSIFILVLVSVISIFGSYLGGDSEEVLLKGGSRGKIAVIDVKGLITENSSSSGFLSDTGVSSEIVISQIDKAVNDDSVKAILIRMNTPGGESVAGDLIYRELLEARNKKPVVTWISSMGASAGYLIASASTEIISHPQAITGSIGCIVQTSSMEGLYDKLGIESRNFTSGEFKDDSGLFDDDLDGEADQIIQRLVDVSYEEFVKSVAYARNMEEDKVREIADGRVLAGVDAKEYGLIDELGDFEDALTLTEKLVGDSGLSVVLYQSGGVWDGLIELKNAYLNPLKSSINFVYPGVKSYYILDL